MKTNWKQLIGFNVREISKSTYGKAEGCFLVMILMDCILEPAVFSHKKENHYSKVHFCDKT